MKSIKNEQPDEQIVNEFADILNFFGVSQRDIQVAFNDMELPKITAEEKSRLTEGDGIVVPPPGRKNFEDEKFQFVEPHQYLTYSQRPICIYIKDQFLSYEEYINNNFRPFHVCWCSALQEAKEQNRFESRYVATLRMDGRFKVNLIVRDEFHPQKTMETNVYKKLRVCHDCLHELNWKNFLSYCGFGNKWWLSGDSRARWKISQDFKIEEYMKIAKKAVTLHQKHILSTGEVATRKEYRLSRSDKYKLKESAGFRCAVCGMAYDEHELQIHHKNHNEGDNRMNNLEVICENCHRMVHEIEGGYRF